MNVRNITSFLLPDKHPIEEKEFGKNVSEVYKRVMSFFGWEVGRSWNGFFHNMASLFFEGKSLPTPARTFSNLSSRSGVLDVCFYFSEVNKELDTAIASLTENIQSAGGAFSTLATSYLYPHLFSQTA